MGFGTAMDRSSLRPLVGISACLKENGKGGWHHTVGEKYVQAAVRAVGALPIPIPAIGPEFDEEAATIEALDRLIDGLDGVLLTGSPSNVEPHHYGKQSREGTLHDPARDATTLPLIRHTIERGVPLFAICRGLQEVNVALGGTLTQHLPDVVGTTRYSLGNGTFSDNEVQIDADSKLAKVFDGHNEFDVKSYHHQAIDEVADGLVVAARSDDGTIQAVELAGVPFGLGVQWHPEAPDSPAEQLSLLLAELRHQVTARSGELLAA